MSIIYHPNIIFAMDIIPISYLFGNHISSNIFIYGKYGFQMGFQYPIPNIYHIFFMQCWLTFQLLQIQAIQHLHISPWNPMATLQAQREDIRRLGRKQCEDVARKSRCLAIFFRS
jgi:hypothetical protein